jgi:hypothetical protein
MNHNNNIMFLFSIGNVPQRRSPRLSLGLDTSCDDRVLLCSSPLWSSHATPLLPQRIRHRHLSMSLVVFPVIIRPDSEFTHLGRPGVNLFVHSFEFQAGHSAFPAVVMRSSHKVAKGCCVSVIYHLPIPINSRPSRLRLN